MPAILTFTGPARIFESQDAAVAGILGGQVAAGDVVVIRYEGPRGGPGMQEMLYPDELPEVEGPRQSLRARHRRPLLRRHLGPVDRPRLAGSRAKAARSGSCEDGDTIEIDIPGRGIRLAVAEDELARRRAAMEAKGAAAWKPVGRQRKVSTALKAYAALTTSAARGAVRDVTGLRRG